MYLHLKNPSAVEMLYKATGLFVALADPLWDRTDQLLPRFTSILQQNSTQLLSIQSHIDDASKRSLLSVGLNPNWHNEEFIRKTLRSSQNRDEIAPETKKFPKNNLSACIRYVRRHLNLIASKQAASDLACGVYVPRRVSTPWPTLYRYLDDLMKENTNGSRYLSNLRPRIHILSVLRVERARMANSVLSSSRCFPRLWTSHMVSHVSNIMPLLSQYALGQLEKSEDIDSEKLTAGFCVPLLPEIHLKKKALFIESFIGVVSRLASVALSRGCPDDLRALLLDDFQYFEEPAFFERYRRGRMHAMAYPKFEVQEQLLDGSLFVGECSRPLGNLLQPRYFDSTTKTKVCRTQPVDRAVKFLVGI